MNTTSNITVKSGERTRITQVHEQVTEQSVHVNTDLAALLGNDQIVVELRRSNLRRNGRLLFDAVIHDGSNFETVEENMTVEEARAFFNGMQTVFSWMTAVAEHSTEDDTGASEMDYDAATDTAADALAA